jgi:hypothetical protein
VPETIVFTHLESLDDPASWEDEALERHKVSGKIPPGKNPL